MKDQVTIQKMYHILYFKDMNIKLISKHGNSLKYRNNNHSKK